VFSVAARRARNRITADLPRLRIDPRLVSGSKIPGPLNQGILLRRSALPAVLYRASTLVGPRNVRIAVPLGFSTAFPS